MSTQYARKVHHRGPWLSALLLEHARTLKGGMKDNLLELTRSSRDGQLIALDSPGPARGYAVVPHGGETVQLHVTPGQGMEAYHALFAEIVDALSEGSAVVRADWVGEEMRAALVESGPDYGIFLDDDRDDASAGPAVVTVTIDYNDGANEPKTLEVDKGSLIEEPSAPGREGAEFESWVAESASGVVDGFDFNAPITEDVTLMAAWSVPESGPTEADDTQADVSSSRYAKMRRVELEAIAKERSVFIPKKIDDLRRALLESDDESEPYDV